MSRGEAVAVIIQARMSSRRLPGKVLRPLAGAPMLGRVIDRARRAALPRAVVVATSTEASDDPVAELAAAEGVACTRGSLDDVLDRFVAAAPPAVDTLVRITADCPLIDPALIDAHIERYRACDPVVGYVSNAFERTQPDGLDVEVFGRAWLQRASVEAVDPYDREHVTPWIRRHAPVLPFVQHEDLSALRWTVDTAEDYAWARSVYDALHSSTPAFGAEHVYALLAREPSLVRVADGSAAPPGGFRAAILRHLDACATARGASGDTS